MYSVENQETFARLLRERHWSDVLSSEDPQSAYALFSQGYIDMFNDCFPLRTVKSGYKIRKPWLSEGLKSQSREKISYIIANKRPKTQSIKLFIKSTAINGINLCRLLNENIMSIAHRLQEDKQNLKDTLNNNKNNLSCSRFYTNNTVCNEKIPIVESFNSFLLMLDPIWRKIFHQILGLQRVLYGA